VEELEEEQLEKIRAGAVEAGPTNFQFKLYIGMFYIFYFILVYFILFIHFKNKATKKQNKKNGHKTKQKTNQI
jgi:hypothetical protein